MDFSKLGKSKKTSSVQSFNELFDQLDGKAIYNSLRSVQIEALDRPQEQLPEHDIVLKVV